ncbi:MAG TPA: hypothetical protein VGI81_19620 [Tepidisphaeraceae bacterium]
MRYTGRLFYPAGAQLNLDLGNLSPIQGHAAYELYGQFKKEMNSDEFDAKVDPGHVYTPVFLRFCRVGETAGFAAFARGPDETVERLEAVLAFLTRLDEADDREVIEQLRQNAHLAGIDDSDWDAAANDTVPLAAAFFTSEQALNDPFIHGLMSLAGAAFFDRLGLLE